MTSSPAQSQPANETIDREHAIQMGLVDALCDAIERYDPARSIDEILEHLVAYSSAHFMSEELLMRLANYDEYEDHVADHIHMMDELNDILANHKTLKSVLVLEKARAVYHFLERHIATRDARFSSWKPS